MEKDLGLPRSAVEGSGVGATAGPSVLQKHSCPPRSVSYLASWVFSDCRLTAEHQLNGNCLSVESCGSQALGGLESPQKLCCLLELVRFLAAASLSASHLFISFSPSASVLV